MKTISCVLVSAGFLLASGCTTIHEAARQGDLARVQKPVRAGTPVESRGPMKATPLFDAARGGHVDVAGFLLAKGADVNFRNERGGSPLHAAACKGQPAMVEFLIARGAKVNARANNGQTPLHKAANVKDRKDNSPGPGHLAAAKVLLKHVAGPHAKDKSGKSPLDLAGTEEMKALLRK